MKIDRRKALQGIGAGLLATAAFGAGNAGAQTGYPDRAVRIVVPYPAGGSLDLVARTIAEQLGRHWPRPIVVENRPGASGMIGADAVAKAPPDGYTLLLTVSSVVQTPYMYTKPLFDPMRDLVPVTDICTTNMVLTAGATGPRTLADVVRIAKQAPGKLAYATYGLGSGSHLYMEVFGSAAGISLIHAPYKGEAPIVNDLLGGQIALGTLSPMVVRQHLRGGKLTPLAVSGDARAPMLPDVPTFEELGYRGLSGPSWFGLFTTRGTPQPVVEKVAADVAAVLAAPDVRQRLADLGLNVKTSTTAAFAKLAKTDQAYWSEVIHKHNIRLD
ncbi:hypothetical protein D9M68_240680 [compost metagenome]